MNYRQLGRCRVNVSRLCLGTMNLGKLTPEAESWKILDRAIELGINFIDTVERHFQGLVSEQSLYNLTNRWVELEVIPACREFGLGLLPWSPLAGGLLSGRMHGEQPGRREGSEVEKLRTKHKDQVEAYETLCLKEDVPPSLAALGWLLSNPMVTAPIIGPRTIAQLEDAVSVVEKTIPPDFLRELDRIWPGPGGEAPEAYTW